MTSVSLARNIENSGMVVGMLKWLAFWGSQQSEHHPSLHRFISTYSLADAEEENCELKTKGDLEPSEEIVERTRIPS